MVAGWICSNGLSNLIILDCSENEFAYAQMLGKKNGSMVATIFLK